MKKRIVADVRPKDCVAAIRDAFPEREYAVLEQVGNDMGWRSHRWADIIALNLWPSRGLLLHGFEVKVSRTDWKKEVSDPSKAEEIQRYCDRWWIVAPVGLIDAEELPPTWGLYEVTEKRKAKLKVAAPPLAPATFTKEFAAALLRRQAQAVDDIIRRERNEARQEGAKEGHGELASRLEHAEEAEKMLRETIDEFKAKSGLAIDKWNVGKIAKAVKMLTDAEFRGTCLASLENERALYERRLELLKKDIEAMKSVRPRSDEAAE